MKYSDKYSITLMCKCLNISRSSFYHYFYYSKSYSDDKASILSRILTIFYNSKKTYGSPRITAVLNEEGLCISQKTVAKYMRTLNLCAVSKMNFPKRKSTITEQEKSKIINLIKNITIIRPNQVWTTDITYIKTKEDGTVYLSSIMDLFSRKIIAWNVGHNMKKELVLETLNNAFFIRNNPIDVIIHSDKGSQYRSYAFRDLIVKHKCLYSYTSLNHSCDENANQESFHATLKKEWLYSHSFDTIHDVRRACFEYIEGFYNTSRIHSSLGFLSPLNFELKFFSEIPLLSMSNLLT